MNTDDIIKCVDKVTDAQVKPYLDELDAQGIKMTPNAAKLRAFSIKIYLAYKSLVDEFKYDAIAVSCWPKFQDDYRYSVCALDFTKTILSGGFEHHYPIARGDYSDENRRDEQVVGNPTSQKNRIRKLFAGFGGC